MAKTIQEIVDQIDDFCNSREWDNADPNQLITSLIIETGELAEHYQWKNEFKKFSKDEQQEVGYEFVDVFFYLFRLASKSGVDLEKYFDEKIIKLEKKFPVGSDCKTQHELYRKLGKNKKYE